MRTVDLRYTISDERLREYAKVPDLERLRWLDDLVQFTLQWRAAAPGALASGASDPASPPERDG